MRRRIESLMKSNSTYEEEVVKLQADKDQIILNMSSIRKEFENLSIQSKEETDHLRASLEDLKSENLKLTSEK